MAHINEIALLSPIAAVNSGGRLRLYVLSNDGNVRQINYEGKWVGGVAKNVIGSVKLTSPLSATSLGELEAIRVYGIAENNTISEFAYDQGKGWYSGGLTGKFRVAPYSSVGAVFLAKKRKLRVYVQAEDNSIQEYSFVDGNSDGWYKDQNLGPALPGTAIAVTAWGNNDNEIGIRVYFQDAEGKVIERAHDARKSKYWYKGGLSFPGPFPRTPLAVVSWEGSAHVRVYYDTADGTVREKAHDGSGWYDGGFSEASVPASRISALSIKGADLRVYIQTGAYVTSFSEFVFNGDGWIECASPLPPF
ncbi:fucose-specific lectin [Epithele typhae]|uniref:fucose-specific lectin n=1 Tax=Epithele typhae TaxID=378194 RepID=UPI002007F223|nr:fucose-specific lectin [Epithele typhae]KAH9939730.1 fucose-specific lectin [Epithele typhae]